MQNCGLNHQSFIITQFRVVIIIIPTLRLNAAIYSPKMINKNIHPHIAWVHKTMLRHSLEQTVNVSRVNMASNISVLESDMEGVGKDIKRNRVRWRWLTRQDYDTLYHEREAQ